MALTLRTNGSGVANIVTASWFDDFYNLFTGVMTDQPVTFGNNFTVKGTTSLDNGTLTTNGSGSLTGVLLKGSSPTTNGAPVQAVLTGSAAGDCFYVTTPNNSFHIGVDSGGSFYIFDNTSSAMVLQNVRGTHTGALSGVIPTFRTAGGGNTGNVIWEGTTDPGGSAGEGDLWIVG